VKVLTPDELERLSVEDMFIHEEIQKTVLLYEKRVKSLGTSSSISALHSEYSGIKSRFDETVRQTKITLHHLNVLIDASAELRRAR
jgi:hypothetical protein